MSSAATLFQILYIHVINWPSIQSIYVTLICLLIKKYTFTPKTYSSAPGASPASAIQKTSLTKTPHENNPQDSKLSEVLLIHVFSFLKTYWRSTTNLLPLEKPSNLLIFHGFLTFLRNAPPLYQNNHHSDRDCR